MSMSNSELGVRWPGFGEYHCKVCNRKWVSSMAWILYGQKCTTCGAIVQAMNLRQLFRYYCRSCKKLWKCKWQDGGLACKDCGEKVKPFKTHAEFMKAETEYILPDRLSHDPFRARANASKAGTSRTRTACDIFELERFCGVRNWSDLPPPPPPPSVNPWNRKSPSPPKPQPQSQLPTATSVRSCQEWPKPAEVISQGQFPERYSEHSIDSTTATVHCNCNTTTGDKKPCPFKNVALVNGVYNHRRESGEISASRSTTNVNCSVNGTHSIPIRNGITPKGSPTKNGDAFQYNFRRQNRNVYADEKSWNLWNCTIQ